MARLIDVEILRVFVGESAHRDGKPLHELVVNEARRRGMAGASVTRGIMGFGANSLIHTAKILRLSEDLPVIVEIVDTPARIADFLPVVDGLVDEGTIVVEQARAIFHLPMRIRDVMSPQVATVAPDTPLPAVIELLLRRQIKALPVLDGKRIAGIITGGDLLRRANMPLRLDIQLQLPADMQAEHIRGWDVGGLTAKDIMTSPVHVLSVKTGVPEALKLMADHALKRLPVVDDAGELLGIVSRVDVLRTIGRAAAVAGHFPSLPEGIRGTARDVMFRDVPTASAETPLKDVLDMLLATPLRRVVVVDEAGRIQGIVLDSDLVASCARQRTPGFFRSLVAALSGKRPESEELPGAARDVMKKEVFTLSADTPLAEVVRLLVERQAKRLVVADGQGRLLGMVDRDAVLRALAGY